MSNAFKFTLRGVITLRTAREGDCAVLYVSDTGAGIPRAELPRLFERFHRVEGAQGRTIEGSGIGLALVQEMVRLHRGTIDVESEPGVGSSPAPSPRPPSAYLRPQRQPAPPPPPPAPYPPGLGPVPLIIDTDMSFDVDDVGAVCVAHALADRGAAAQEAPSGASSGSRRWN